MFQTNQDQKGVGLERLLVRFPQLLFCQVYLTKKSDGDVEMKDGQAKRGPDRYTR